MPIHHWRRSQARRLGGFVTFGAVALAAVPRLKGNKSELIEFEHTHTEEPRQSPVRLELPNFNQVL